MLFLYLIEYSRIGHFYSELRRCLFEDLLLTRRAATFDMLYFSHLRMTVGRVQVIVPVLKDST